MIIGVVAVILIGVALSADAMSVTVCNLVAHPTLARSRAVLMPLLFGIFQGLMPVVGYYVGSIAAGFVETYAGLITLLILGIIGSKMVWDGIHDSDVEDVEGALDMGNAENPIIPARTQGISAPKATRHNLSIASILAQAVATSIDALAVGVTFAATREPILLDAGIIALCTFALCLAMVVIGRKLGTRFGNRAQIIGGVVLILVGLRAFFF